MWQTALNQSQFQWGSRISLQHRNILTTQGLKHHHPRRPWRHRNDSGKKYRCFWAHGPRHWQTLGTWWNLGLGISCKFPISDKPWQNHLTQCSDSVPAFEMLWPSCKRIVLQVAGLSPCRSPVVAASRPLNCQLSFSLLRHLDLASVASFGFIHLA